MSVTPDFIGQIYKDTNTGNLWRSNSLTAGDWTLELQNSKLFWTPRSSEVIDETGMFTYGPTAGFADLIYEGTSSEQGFDFEGTSDLVSFSAPNLLTIGFSGLFTDLFYFFGNTALISVSAPQLISTVRAINIESNPLLTTVNLQSLSETQRITIKNNPSLQVLSFPALTSMIAGNCNCSGCGLLVASVNAILSNLVSMPLYGGSGETVDLSGGTNAAPAGQGITDKNTLIGRGATVNTN